MIQKLSFVEIVKFFEITLSDDKHLANTDSAINVTGIPCSNAEIAVHFPVPFCPAASLILVT